MTSPPVFGTVAPGFEPVREAFADNFTRRNELGGACAVVRHGELVFDLWGGVRDRATGAPWEKDTMVLVHSLTKGMSALALAVSHARGGFSFDDSVSDHWPEFARSGKGAITIRQLLAHQAALQAFHQRVDRAVIADLDRLAQIMEAERPLWPPGTRYAYHIMTLGFYENELMRRVDPERRTIGQVFQEEIAAPLGAEFYIRVPENIPNDRFAVLEFPGLFASITALPPKMLAEALMPWSHIFRSAMVNPGTTVALDKTRVYQRNLELPSGGGVGTARAIAQVYGEFASGAPRLGIGSRTLDELAAPGDLPTGGRYDWTVKGQMEYGRGFMKPCPSFPFGGPDAYGAPGAGGSMGIAHPSRGIGYGYVTSRMGAGIAADPRDIALREALDSVA